MYQELLILGHRFLVATQYVFLSSFIGPAAISIGPALFMYIFHKYVVSYYVDLEEPEDRRHARRLEELFGFTFHYYIQAFGYLLCALYLIVMCGANPFINPLMNNATSVDLHDLAFPVYAYIQLALYLFSVFGRGFSLSRAVASGLRSFHLVALYLLNMFWRMARIAFPHGLLIMLLYYDVAAALVDFQMAADGESSKFIGWPGVRTIWLVSRFFLPAFALYMGSLGYGITFFIIIATLIFQLFLFCVLPNTRRRRRRPKQQ